MVWPEAASARDARRRSSSSGESSNVSLFSGAITVTVEPSSRGSPSTTTFPEIEKRAELLHCDARLANQGTERSFADLAMIRNGEAAMRRLRMAEDDVAAALPIDLIPEPPEGSDSFSRDPGKDAHSATSITSSEMAGGMGSPRSRRLSR